MITIHHFDFVLSADYKKNNSAQSGLFSFL